MALAFGFVLQSKAQNVNPHEWKFSGTYGLYVGTEQNKATIKWLTDVVEPGYILVQPTSGEPFIQKTDSGRSHTYQFDIVGDRKYHIKFGALAEENGRYEIDVDFSFSPDRVPDKFRKVDSIYVMSDIHGEYKNVQQMLMAQGIIDGNNDWIAGGAHLLVDGDIFDRGHDVTRLLWMLYKLEKQAEQAGGKLHIVLGNHEIMTFTNDLRFISPKENAIAVSLGLPYQKMYDVKTSLLGKWLVRKPSMLIIDDVLFTHGGAILNYGDYSHKVFNDSAYRFMHEPVFNVLGVTPLDTINYNKETIFHRNDFFYGMYSPYWFRGYVESDTLGPYLDLILEKHRVKLHVVGHTYTPQMEYRYDGKLIAIDIANKGTQMLLLVRQRRRKYDAYRLTLDGEKSLLEK